MRFAQRLKPLPHMSGRASDHVINPFWIVAGISILLLMIVEDTVKIHLANSPLDYTSADMLPVIKVMCERYLHHEPVYDIIPEIWGGIQPIYLPAMWMPFLISESMSIDLRWMTTIMVWLASFLSLWIVFRRHVQIISWIPLLSLVLIFWGVLLHLDFTYFTLTEEGIVVGYYGLLCYALLSNRAGLIGLSAGLCVMSRYALIPWLIAYFLFLLYRRSYRSVFKTGKVFFITCLVLLLISGGFNKIGLFVNLDNVYLDSILNNPDKYKTLINNSLGLAKFWNYEDLGLLHILFKLAIFVGPAVFFIRYRNCSSQEYDVGFISMLGLKLCLVIFYNLLIMPYSYLFYTSTIVSLFIVAHLTSSSELTNSTHV